MTQQNILQSSFDFQHQVSMMHLILDIANKSSLKPKHVLQTDGQYLNAIGELETLFTQHYDLTQAKKYDKAKKIDRKIIKLCVEIVDYEKFFAKV